MDFEQLDIHLDKNLAILKSFQRDWNQINLLNQQIGIWRWRSHSFIFYFLIFFILEQSTLNENASIHVCKSDLVSAKQVLQNRLEYDQIANEVLKLQTRSDLLK